MNLCSDQRETLRTQVGKIYAHVKPVWKSMRITDPEWIHLCEILEEMERVLADAAQKNPVLASSSSKRGTLPL